MTEECKKIMGQVAVYVHHVATVTIGKLYEVVTTVKIRCNECGLSD